MVNWLLTKVPKTNSWEKGVSPENGAVETGYVYVEEWISILTSYTKVNSNIYIKNYV